jgi:hypothetical protein
VWLHFAECVRELHERRERRLASLKTVLNGAGRYLARIFTAHLPPHPLGAGIDVHPLAA